MVGLIDGLGGEEVNQSGGGPISEFAYASDISGALVQGTQGTFTTGSITGLRAGNVISPGSVTDGSGKLESHSMGASAGAWIQAGSNALGAGSEVWVAFEESFGTGPQSVLVTNNTTTAKPITTGSFSTGSFVAWGGAASDAFSWLAVGLR